jgi:class 3 adenylate cyclase
MTELSNHLSPGYRQSLKEFGERYQTGVLTLLFTDMVGSAQLKQELGDKGGVALIKQQQEIVRDILISFKDAREISTAGDSFFIAFIRPSDAVSFAIILQAALREESRSSVRPLAVRVGIHMGEVFIEREGEASAMSDLYGLQVDAAARVQSLAEGGQTLMTRSVFDNARAVEQFGQLKPLSWLNHGPYKVKGLDETVEICEAGETGIAPLKAPQDTEKARRHINPEDKPVLGWHPALEQEVPGTRWILNTDFRERISAT